MLVLRDEHFEDQSGKSGLTSCALLIAAENPFLKCGAARMRTRPDRVCDCSGPDEAHVWSSVSWLRVVGARRREGRPSASAVGLRSDDRC